jgi:glutamate carboxypeptidase
MRTLNQIEAAAVDAAGAEPMLAQVEAWSAVNSGSRNLEGLAEVAGFLADAFSALPGALTLVDPAPVEAVHPDGRTGEIAHGRNLHLQVRPEAPVQLLFTGHMDTVFAPEHPFQQVFWREPDAVLGGPGVADMKGGLAVMLAALKAAEASSARDRFGYEVVINSDEEVGSPGSAALIADAARGKAAAFTYEPSALPDGTLAGARPGSGNFSLVVTGRSAHAGRNPDEGRNALLAAAALALRLEQAKAPGITVNPARIDGGSPNNVVPNHAILRVNLRPRTPADQDAAQAALEQAVAEIEAARDVRIAIHGGWGRPPKPLTGDALRLFELVARAGADLGQSIGWRDSGGVCDGNNIAACGVPVVDTMGVRGGAIHSAEEYLIVESLSERAQLSALAILRLIEGGLE